MPRLHRNNLAEWIMVIVLTPIAWIVRGWRRIRKFRENREPGGSAAGVAQLGFKEPKPRQSVMIEGLPPRTMN